MKNYQLHLVYEEQKRQTNTIDKTIEYNEQEEKV